MRRITEEHLADLCEADYRNLMGVTREEFGRMLQALELDMIVNYKRNAVASQCSCVRFLVKSGCICCILVA